MNPAAAHPRAVAGASQDAPSVRARFHRFAWGVLAYNVLVILWGALVRATKSGAGCGGNWPLCNGEFVPAASQTATVIEFTHRVMSGVALIAVVGLLVWAWKAYPAGHLARRWAAWSMVFICTEALIGAALVLLGHVAANESVGRVYSLSTHLVNTFLLLASLALTAWHASDSEVASRDERAGAVRASGRSLTALAIVALVGVALAGAITALGDTLFPSHSLAQGVAEDFSATANFLVRLRIIHPAIAVMAGAFIAILGARAYLVKQTPRLRFLGAALIACVCTEILAGIANVLLQAPVPMQLVHLLIADALWITLVLFASERLRVR